MLLLFDFYVALKTNVLADKNRGIAAVNWFERSAAGGRRSDVRTGRNRESQKSAKHLAETTNVSTGAGRWLGFNTGSQKSTRFDRILSILLITPSLFPKMICRFLESNSE